MRIAVMNFQGLPLHVVVLLLTLFHGAQKAYTTATSSVHHHMSKDEIQQVFHVFDHEDVPEHQLIHIHSRIKRSADGSHSHKVSFKAFEQTFNLNLIPNEHLKAGKDLPLIYADPKDTETKGPEGVIYQRAEQTDAEDIGLPYQDVKSQAALIIEDSTSENGGVTFDGTLGTQYVVRPAPPSVHRVEPPPDDEFFMDSEIGDDLASMDGFPMTNATNKGLHIVFKRSVKPVDADFAYMEPDKWPLKKQRTKRSPLNGKHAPTIIYPEILVIIDYDGYVLHSGDNRRIKKYFVSFWNGVDLRYKLLGDPRVRVSIAGIIISRGRDATSYLERNKVGRDAIDSAAALTDMGKYLFIERRLPTYDVAVAVTRLDMCRRQAPGSKCNRGTAGFAYVGGACVVNKRLEKVNSVAIVEDTGGFSGIIVAAHEVGHLLGAVHDGSPPPSYLGGPGATACRWEDGFIMSDLRHTDRGFQWSDCSVEQFHHFLNGDTATCLYNVPHEDDILPRVLPGSLLTLDAQCRKDRGTSACFKDERVCAQLFCFDAKTGYCVSYRPAAEGSPCGAGQFCVGGKCVSENNIPEFSNLHESFELDRNVDMDIAASKDKHAVMPVAAERSDRGVGIGAGVPSGFGNRAEPLSRETLCARGFFWRDGKRICDPQIG